jgi:hypothetical protein
MPCPPLSPNEGYFLFPGANIRVTTSTSPNNARSESVVVANPRNDQHLICASKKFLEPQIYHGTISTSYTMDGGTTWTESEPPREDGWDGMTDPDLTFDTAGNAYLIVEPLIYPSRVPGDIKTIGMFVYRSVDGGRTWQTPVEVHLSSSDDKQWIEADTNWASPHAGTVYAVWGAWTPLRFARSRDQGKTWQGAGGSPAGSDVTVEEIYAPSLTIGEDGTIHVTWVVPGTTDVKYVRSTDGGDTFSPVTTIVRNIKDLDSFLPKFDQFAQFDPDSFRVVTLTTSCMAAGNRLIVAWADIRNLVSSRIFYRIGADGGTNWLGSDDGQPLLTVPTDPAQHHFHPHLAPNGSGAIGCAYYDYGPKQEHAKLIDVHMTFSCDDGDTFHVPSTITDHPWDPMLNPPWSRGISQVKFIGEYFGFCGVRDAFGVLWTDTRTGFQELFYDRAGIRGVVPSYARISPAVVDVLAGVVQDGGGLVYAGGKVVRIPPLDPWIDVLHALVAMDAAKNIRDPEAHRAIAALQRVIASVAQHQLKAGAEPHE